MLHPQMRGGGEVRNESRAWGQWAKVYRLRGGYIGKRNPHTALMRTLLELIPHGLRGLLSLLPPPSGY